MSVVGAEFLDERHPDGRVDPDESIRLRLDAPLPPEAAIENITAALDPPAAGFAFLPARESDPRTIELRLIGRAEIAFAGVHGRDAAASGLIVDLGDGIPQAVDLQLVRRFPRLVRAEWQDSSPAAGNAIVDEGDRIRLFFDFPVELAPGAEGGRVRVPQEILLSRDGGDRLDDGTRHSRYAAGSEDNEVVIVLGSQPLLNIAGKLEEVGGRIDRHAPESPSGLALNGTELLPMGRIRGRRDGAGVVSDREIDIEYGADFPLPRPLPEERFPVGGRRFHTVTPFAGVYAIVAGGESSAGEAARLHDDLLIYRAHRGGGEPAGAGLPPFTELAERLPAPVEHHTATLLSRGGLEDLVVIAGGFDGRQSTGALTVVRILESGTIVAESLETGLRVPRHRHRAVALSEKSLLIDGGRTIGPDGQEAVVGCAEVITLEGGASEPLRVRVEAFHSLAREEHTLTLLAAGERDHWVVGFGGFGYPDVSPDASLGSLVADAAACLRPLSGARVLPTAVLWSVEKPEASEILDDVKVGFSNFRRGHVAVAFGGDPADRTGAGSAVLIAGGTTAPPREMQAPSERGDDWKWWAIPPRALHLFERHPLPEDSLNALVLQLDPATPQQSKIELIPHPAPDPSRTPPRAGAAALYVPGIGIVICGGGTGDEILGSLEVFSIERRNLVPFALRLAAPRTHHQLLLAERGGGLSLLVVGGETSPALRSSFQDVEELPLPPRSR